MAELKIQAPRLLEVDADMLAAHELAIKAHEPVFVPASLMMDDRGWSIMNQLQGVMAMSGQINFSLQYPGTIKAWHRHLNQADFWMCLHGHIKIGVYREDDEIAWQIVVGEKRPGVMVIPPELWHGAATVGNENAGLLYYVTQQYNPDQPDEQRMPFNKVAGFTWQVQHR